MSSKSFKYKYIVVLILCLLVGVFFVFGPEFIDVNTFTQGHDAERQMHAFYTEMSRLIDNLFRNGALPFYSWNMFLGTNFYASQTFYVFGEIFGLIGLLFNMDYFNLATVLYALKLFVAGITMYCLLSNYKFDYKVKIIGSIAYAFSTWAFIFSDHPTFLTFYTFAPLFFAGMDRYLTDKKFVLFVVSTTLLITTNYYFFFTLSCFASIYFIFRFYILDYDWKQFMKRTLILIGYYLIGVLISMFLILPTIFYIMGNDRVGELTASLFYDPQIYLHVISSLFMPPYPITFNAFSTGWYTTEEIFMLSSLLITLLLPQAFFMKNKKLFKSSLTILSLLFVIAMTPFFAAALHGFSEPSFRWMMFGIIFTIILACYVLDKRELINKKVLVISFFVGIFAIVCCPMISYLYLYDNINIFLNFTYVAPILFSCFVYFLLFLILYYQPKPMFFLLIIIIIIETGIYGRFAITRWKYEEINTFKYQDELYSVLQDKEGKFIKFLDEIEPINKTEYYRIFVPFESLFWQYGYNMPLTYGFQGFMTYDSTYAPSLNKLIDYFPEITRNDENWTMNIEDYDLLTFLNMKYAVVAAEDDLPKNGNYKLITDSYRGWMSVYRNDNYRSLGTTYSNIMVYPESIDADSLVNTLYVEQEDYDSVKKHLKSKSVASLENINYHGNQLLGYAYSDEESFMVITLPYDAGWNIKVNGQDVKTYNVNCGFIGIPIQKGDNSIEMYFTPQGFKQGCILSLAGVVMFITVILVDQYCRRRKRNEEK